MKKLMAIAVAVVLLLAIALPATVVAAPGTEWHVPDDYDTIQEAIDSNSVVDGDTILVGPGSHAGALVTKSVMIKGEGGAVIDDGPVYGFIYGFLLLAGSDGATISHLRFEVDFPIMGSLVNDITVKHCTLINPLQGISNWGGSGWQISHNNIVDLRAAGGGGIGILIADWTAVPEGVRDNLVSHNKITGTLQVALGDSGYDGAGINLYADFRWGAPGAVAIADNRVVHNKVSLTSDNPTVVDIAAIALEDSRGARGVIYGNVVGFNDLRGTELQIDLLPEELDEDNIISRNLGDNRGHGIVPADVFRPVPDE